MADPADSWLQLAWRPFALPLPQPLGTAAGVLTTKRGWLLRLNRADGAVGWGEAAPLALQGAPSPTHDALAAAITALGLQRRRRELDACLAQASDQPALGFALGSALAELEGRVGSMASGGSAWLASPPGAVLLPAGSAALGALERALQGADAAAPTGKGLTVKWKVAVEADADERGVLEQLLARLPATARLRLDANGGWDRPTAHAWAERLADEPRLQWLEQPLPPADQAGLEALAQRLPVALDESLLVAPDLRHSWSGWQVRRPSQEGDPRPLLAALAAGRPRLMLSTSFETGIACRWLHHLAALQAQGPTPVAPGLASDWQASGPLLSADPAAVWEAAA